MSDKKKAVYRHGDVMLLAPTKIPGNAVRVPDNIVARGEVTGHAHRLESGDVMTLDKEMWVSANDGAALNHEQHGHEPISPTKAGEGYPVVIQREYDDEKEWRQVAD